MSEFRPLVQEKLALGILRSQQEVLQGLVAQEQTLAAIAEGYADIQAGHHRPFDEADVEFRQRHNLPLAT